METRTSNQILDTLEKCNGIKIIKFSRNFYRNKRNCELLFLMAERLGAKSFHREDQSELILKNGSRLTLIPYGEHENHLCGYRCNQVVTDEDIINDTKFVDSIARPLLTCSYIEDGYCPFPVGVYLFKENFSPRRPSSFLNQFKDE